MKKKNGWSSIVWQGLLTLLPIYLTIYFIIWLLASIENSFSVPFRYLLDSYYIPGMGLLFALIFVIFIGIIMQWYVAQYLRDSINKGLSKIPLIGDVYSSLKTITTYMNASSREKGEEVVMVKYGDTKLLGIVTRKDLSDAPEGIKNDKEIAVYLPMSYQIGGFTLYIPKSKLTKVNMSVNKALKWTLMGGIK